MKTEEIIVSSQGSGWDESMAVTERLGTNSGLDKKSSLRLRLLAEELIGMTRGIAGKVEAVYWAENTGRRFDLHLKSDIIMTQDIRRQIIAVSSSGENSANRGFIGKIREMIAVALLPDEFGISVLSGLSLGMMGVADGSPETQMIATETMNWSLIQYRNKISQARGEAGKSEEADTAWDELEKSIVASIADEIIVRVTGSHVEIDISKTF